MENPTPPRGQGRSSVNRIPTRTYFTTQPTHMSVQLALPEHTFEKIRQVLISLSHSNACAILYISHPVSPITMNHIHQFHVNLRPGARHRFSVRLIFHHLRFTAVSALTPSNRTLHLTIDNNTYHIIPPRRQCGGNTSPKSLS